MPELVIFEVIRAWIVSTLHRPADEQDGDRGDVPGWVIVTAITIGLAIAIGAIIVSKVTAKANSINLQ